MLNKNIKLILAPMAGFADHPFRRVCRRFGADEVVTELLSANALVRDNLKTMKMTELHPEEIPAVMQIFGADPDVMAEAARIVEQDGSPFIDINMGCPVKKVVKTGAGAALLDNHPLAARIVKKVVDAVKTPVSVKIRTGKTRALKSGFELALALADSGASRITVHARTVEDRFCGPVDYDFVAELKKRLNVEIIGNGGIESTADAEDWLERTGADGLMVGRGALGHPSLFRAIHAGEDAPPVETAETVLLHCELMEEYYDPERAIGPMRGHLMYYSKGCREAKQFREAVNHAETFDTLKDIVREFFSGEPARPELQTLTG